MGVDYLAIDAGASAREALEAVGRSRNLQPEALTSVHAVDESGLLVGVARLVSLLQADPDARLTDICDTDPVRVGPDTDVMDVAVLMTDYNLITIPVVDEERRILGLITVDDVLEVTLPDDWRRREAAMPPDSHRGEQSPPGTPGEGP
jgi:Mg/Co/Ni transporter MgtE